MFKPYSSSQKFISPSRSVSLRLGSPGSPGGSAKDAGFDGIELNYDLENDLTFKYFHPYPHYPEALIVQTADSLNRMLGISV